MIASALSWIERGRNGLWLGLVVVCALVAMGWIGFLASDDVTYAIGAYGWIEHFPFVGGHGTIRYPITIPMALSFVTFGENEYAMVLPSLLYMLGFLVFVWHVVRDIDGSWAATSVLGILAISPLLVIQSSIASVDIVEMSFLFASVLLFWRCLDTGPNPRRLFVAGAMAGLAFLTRETAIFVAVFYAILFLIGHRFHRGHYLWIAAGFLSIWAIEIIYLWVMTGDPLYRINISLHHDSTIDRTIDVAGNTVIHPLIDPLLVLLINQEFMALFFIAIPIGAWLCFGSAVDQRTQHFARIISLFGITWFLCAAAAQKLLPLNPRYFMITTAVACVLTGIGFARLLASGKAGQRLMVGGLALLLLGGNFVGIYLENKDSLFGPRQLAAIAAERPDAQIVTDPMTRYRADMLLRWEGARSRVSDRPATPGDLFYYNPAFADQANFKMPADRIPLFHPGPDARLLAQYEPRPIHLALFIEAMGLSTYLPDGLWKKLRYRHPAVMLYRIAEPKRPNPIAPSKIQSTR
jgi:4-amino-4-deoxy-L-arabinose transferase-like glycosyltransferase